MRDLHLTRRTMAAALLGMAAAPLRAAQAAPPALPGIVAADARLARVFGSGRWCEGPAWDRGAGAASGSLVFSDVRSDRLLRLAGDGDAVPVRDPAGNSNGNAFDAQGRLVTCEHRGRRVVRQEPDGRLTVLADRYLGRRFNAPNDLAIARDGAVWFTDPTFGLDQPDEGRQAPAEQPGRFVFRLDPAGSLAVVADSLEQPNGIAFSPDQGTLYVTDASGGPGKEGRHEIRAFDVSDGRRLGRERVFAAVEAGVVDGLAVDASGRVFGATDQGATVWAPDGRRLGCVRTPVTCANLAFGGPDGRLLFLCCGSSIYRIETTTKGAAWA